MRNRSHEICVVGGTYLFFPSPMCTAIIPCIFTLPTLHWNAVRLREKTRKGEEEFFTLWKTRSDWQQCLTRTGLLRHRIAMLMNRRLRSLYHAPDPSQGVVWVITSFHRHVLSAVDVIAIYTNNQTYKQYKQVAKVIWLWPYRIMSPSLLWYLEG